MGTYWICLPFDWGIGFLLGPWVSEPRVSEEDFCWIYGSSLKLFAVFRVKLSVYNLIICVYVCMYKYKSFLNRFSTMCCTGLRLLIVFQLNASHCRHHCQNLVKSWISSIFFSHFEKYPTFTRRHVYFSDSPAYCVPCMGSFIKLFPLVS